MKKLILLTACTGLFLNAKAASSIDSVRKSFDRMDKQASDLEEQSGILDAKIKNAQHRIDSIELAKKMKDENAKLLKPNYFWPIVGGAIAGLALAVIIRRRKKK